MSEELENTTDLAVACNGAETAALFDPNSADILTPQDRDLLVSILSKSERVNEAFPDGMPVAELWNSLNLCAKVFVRARRATGQLKLLIGRALVVVQDTPEVYKSRGFETFTEFIGDEDRGLPAITGISRGELFKCKSVALAAGGNINIRDVGEIGFNKLQLITKYSRPGDSNFQPLMDAAKKETIPQLSERLAREGLADADEITWDVVQLTVTTGQKKLINDFLRNPSVVSRCGTESVGMIMEYAIAELQSEWEIQNLIIEGEAREV